MSHQCNRRHFLAGAGAFVTVTLLPLPGQEAIAAPAKVVKYPRKKIGTVSGLKKGFALPKAYPNSAKDPLSGIFLVKLGEKAGAGVGPDGDIVAYSAYCTHMGMTLHGSYKPDHAVMGPCPLHLTTFDLTRHGMVVAGHATESLPQILLEVDGDDIYATGVMGLVFGRHDNHA